MSESLPVYLQQIFPHYGALGKELQKRNANLSKMNPFKLGKMIQKKHPEVRVEKPWYEQTLPGPLDLAGMVDEEALGGGGEAALKTAGGLFEGAFSGSRLGADTALLKGISSLTGMNYEKPTGYARFIGEVLGEIRVPYRLLHAVLGETALFQSAVKMFPQAAKVGLSGVESAIIEGTKGAIQFENPLGHAAQGLVLGAAPEGIVRVGGKLFNWGARSALKPQAHELGYMKETEDLAKRVGVTLDPLSARPMSSVTQTAGTKVGTSIGGRGTMMEGARRTIRELGEMRENMAIRLGDNGALISTLDAGEGIIESLKATRESLYNQGEGLYKNLSKTDIGQVDIHPLWPGTRNIVGSEPLTGTLIGGLKAMAKKGEGLAPTSQMNRLKILLRKIISEADAAPGERPLMSAPKGLAKQTPEQLARSQALWDAPPEFPANYKTYNWWWAQVRDIGRQMKTTEVQKDPSTKALWEKAYHHIQDHIDLQASSVSPAYNEIVTEARVAWTSFRVFESNKTVQAIRALEEGGNPAAAVETLFSDTAAVRRAKELLGPETFNTIRQTWIRDMISNNLVHDTIQDISYVSGTKLTNSLAKHTDGGIDSQYIEEIFSDSGFKTPDGKVLTADTGALDKLQMFRDLFIMSRRIEIGLNKMLAPGQEALGAGQERMSGGTLSKDLTTGGTKAMSLIHNLLMMKKGAEKWTADPAGNIFFGRGSMPDMGPRTTSLTMGLQRNPVLSGPASPIDRFAPQPLGGEIFISPRAGTGELSKASFSSVIMNGLVNRTETDTEDDDR